MAHKLQAHVDAAKLAAAVQSSRCHCACSFMRGLGALSLPGLHATILLARLRPRPRDAEGWRALEPRFPAASRAPDRRGLRRGAGRQISRLMPSSMLELRCRPAPGAQIVGPHPAGGRRAELNAASATACPPPPSGMLLAPIKAITLRTSTTARRPPSVVRWRLTGGGSAASPVAKRRGESAAPAG